jgi:hypothetical protein
MNAILGFGHWDFVIIIITASSLYIGYLEFDKRFPPK